MNILTAVLCVGGVGIVFGILLAVASKFFAVEKDPRLELICEALPGANCGGCGYAGCSNLASAILEGKAPVTGCPVGGEASAAKIAEIMGVGISASERTTATVLCSGNCGEDRFIYEGLTDCLAASNLAGGSKNCKYACMGMGTCVSVCPFDAISIVDGVATVNEDKCKSCGKCVEACPKQIIKIVPVSRKVEVKCSSKDKGIITKNSCETGCIGCKMCERNCEAEAVRVIDNCAVIDYSRCTGCGVCVQKCIRKTIVERN